MGELVEELEKALPLNKERKNNLDNIRDLDSLKGETFSFLMVQAKLTGHLLK